MSTIQQQQQHDKLEFEPPLKGQIAPPAPAPTSTTTKRKALYALLAAVVVAVVVAVPVTVTQFSVHSRTTRGTSTIGTSTSSSVLSQDYCTKLHGDPKTYCKAYLKAKGPSKFMAASLWLQVSQATREQPIVMYLHAVCVCECVYRV